jgi:uncharacterized protein (DUF305 family)
VRPNPPHARELALAVTAFALVVGCSSDDTASPSTSAPTIVQIGAPGEPNRALTREEITALSVPSYSQTDVDFVHGMLAHHEQALIMTSLVADRSTHEQLGLFVQRLDISQTDEIALMETWLDEREENVAVGSAGHIGHMGQMPGMLSEAEIDQLEQSTGAEFDRLFLAFMIRHHEGALTMVDDLFNSEDGGLETTIYNLASHIISDQEIEISRMTEMLAELDA